MENRSQLSLLAAFTGGLISFLSPCTLPLVPRHRFGNRASNALCSLDDGRIPELRNDRVGRSV